MRFIKKHCILALVLLGISALQAQTEQLCIPLLQAARANLEKKDKEARSPLKQFLDRNLNPAKTIRGGIELPGYLK